MFLGWAIKVQIVEFYTMSFRVINWTYTLKTSEVMVFCSIFISSSFCYRLPLNSTQKRVIIR
jgi:hypothetical protein